MKGFPLYLLILGVALKVVEWAACYCMGFTDRTLWEAWRLAAVGATFVVLLVLFLFILGRREMTVSVIGFCALSAVILMGSVWRVSNYAVLLGIRDSLVRTGTVDELQQFAVAIHQAAPHSYQPPGKTKVFTGRDLDSLGMRNSYSFLKWGGNGGGLNGPAYVSELDGLVNVRWGSSALWRWGFSIVPQKTIANTVVTNADVLHVQENVYAVIDGG